MSHRLVIFGTSTFGLPAFTSLHEHPDVEIAAVVTQPPRPIGRHHELRPSAVHAWATEREIPVLTPLTLKTDDVVNQLRAQDAELYVVAAYGLIVPPPILTLPARGAINIHASLLPRWRGASPIAAAIAAGDTTTGVTFMLMDQGLDTGPMLKSFSLPIGPREFRDQLERRLSDQAAEQIIEVIEHHLADRTHARPQPNDGVTSAPRLTRADGQAVWDDAGRLERVIRGYTPWPGVWTRWGEHEVKLLDATVDPTTSGDVPGTIVARPDGWGIACARGTLVPTTVQFSGRKPIAARQVPGSYPSFIGSKLS